MTITLTPRELEATTDALDTTLIEFEGNDSLDSDPEMNARYETLKSLYTKLLNLQLGIIRV